MTEKINHYYQENDIVLTIILDWAKAFKSLSLDIFIEKTEKFGFGETLRFASNLFPINRKQCVRKRKAEPDWTIINHGAPQGTALEPLVY